jgi:hypothetical protein
MVAAIVNPTEKAAAATDPTKAMKGKATGRSNRARAYAEPGKRCRRQRRKKLDKLALLGVSANN